MGFFLVFVSCCGSGTLRSEDPTCSTKPLVPPPSLNPRQKRRGAPDWRPSLGSISEDGGAAPLRQGGAVGPGRDAKRRSSGGASVAAAAKVHHRNYSDNCDYGYRRAAMPTIMPAFSPTPFMF